MDVRMKDSLDAIFRPRSVAVVGASNNPGRWGWFTIHCLLLGGHSRIYPVHPSEEEIQGLRCYPSLSAIPGDVDLAVIAVNASLAPSVVKECIAKKVRGGIVITAGFAEINDEGAEVQGKIAAEAKEAGFYFIGPNSRGIWSAEGRVNTDMAANPPDGPISFISQSGTLAEYCFAAASRNGTGVTKYISCGNMASVTFNDLLEYLKDDPATGVITGYVEDIKDGRQFVDVARKVTAEKPVLVFKAGSSEASARAARSHTAAMAANDKVFEAACRQTGVIRCYNIDDMFDMADAICHQPSPKGNRVAVLSGGGGFCVVTAESCTRLGLELPELYPDAQKAIREQMQVYSPPPVNPVDLIAPKSQEAVLKIIEIVAGQDNIDGLILTPRLGQFDRFASLERMMESIEFAERLAEIPKRFGKPLILAALIFETYKPSGPAFEIYKRNHIPFFVDPESCAKAMYGLVKYGEIKNQR
ncbi:MAG: hypothetical protein GY866_29135 [Proteobacteria bacterium]|nr:hypothetical protein [Pseudomonadota bacterium]